ncbi:hypothetical protein GQ457_04G017720 [Hibiscus cannabinus]
MGMRNKNIYVMQSHVSFTLSNKKTTTTTTSTSTRNSSRHIRNEPQPLTLELRLAYQAQSKTPNIIKSLLNHVKTFPLTDTPSSNPESQFSTPRSFQLLV